MNITNDSISHATDAVIVKGIKFDEALRMAMHGHDIARELPSGKLRTLRQVKPGEVDCSFLYDKPLIVTVNENCNDQCLGVWTTIQEDIFSPYWMVLHKKSR